MTSSCWNALTLNTSRLPHLPTALYPLYNVYTAVSLYLFDDNFTLQTLFLWCVYLFKIFSDSCVVITMFVLPWSTWCGRLVLPLKELELSCRRECLQCDRMVQMSIVDCMCVSAMWQDGSDVDRVNGVNAAELAAKVQRHAGVSTLPNADEPTAEKVCCVVCCTVILISYCL